MSKYQPLHEYLTNLPATASDVTLCFDEVDQILGDRLPASASQYSAWWANEVGATMHTQAQAWLSAGWRVDGVELTQRWVRFRRGQGRMRCEAIVDGRIIVRKQMSMRGQRKRVDYLLYSQANLPIAIIEAKLAGGEAARSQLAGAVLASVVA